jgi:hypothetical protein
MPNNKLKEKVGALTRVVQQLINEVQKNSTMSQGTLTALQVYLGEEDWDKLVKQLQEREQESLPKEKKLEL